MSDLPAPHPDDGAADGDPLSRLLAGRFRDPETGAALGVAVRAVAIDDDLTDREVELVAALGLGPRLAVVSDVDTAAALGDRVARALAARFALQPVVLGRHPHADEDTVARLDRILEPGVDALVAVGSGTVSDLCKVVAHRRGRPYVVFATAPSMNGYTSGNAAISVDGLRRSLRATAPVGVFFDLRVLAAAPVRMIRAGLGDSLCRSTAQADWLLAHLLLDQPYRAAPFALLAGDEPALVAQADALVAGDLAVMRQLARTLVLSGFGMAICDSSQPASQGEHLISHYLDMTRHDEPEALHGEQVGVASIAMAALQTRMLDRDRPPRLVPSTVSRDEVRARFGPGLGESCWRELAPKLLDRDRAEALDARLALRWDELRTRIGAISLGAARLTAALAAAGAPTTPATLAGSAARFDDAVGHAREIRNRYTFLDLAADSRP